MLPIAEYVFTKATDTLLNRLYLHWSYGKLSPDDKNRADILKALTTDPAKRKAIAREFEAISDRILSELSNFINTKKISDERNRVVIDAYVYALIDSFDERVAIQYDRDATGLSQHILDQSQGLISEFSDAEKELFNKLIEKTCFYIIEIVYQLPAYNENALGVILENLRSVEKTLNDFFAGQKKIQESSRSEFEANYRRMILHHLNHMELFVSDARIRVRKYPLNVAYIQLSASLTDSNQSNRTLRIHDLLEQGERFVIRGQAGSGKTTVLKWIACQAANNAFDESLKSWNKMPFFIRLRQFADGDLPRIEEFPNLIAKSLGQQPQNWVSEQLNNGAAIILIDGVDEVLRRDKVHSWVEELIELYGDKGNHFIVSSRSEAVEGDWLAQQNFQDAMLNSLEISDVWQLISHWHEAVAKQFGAEVLPLAGKLKLSLEDNHTIRKLATNPLLCAMICALHRDLRQKLPKDRLDLYQQCIDMLIHERDDEREIIEKWSKHQGKHSYPELDLEQKRSFLQNLAYYMVSNNEVMLSFEDAEKCIEDELPQWVNLSSDITPANIRELLLNRSGVLRSPVENQLDFVHKTFQEFLAAKEAVDRRNYGLLADSAHNDRWHEVIILATGLGDVEGREKILKRIIKQGDDTVKSEEQYTLYLLAVACLEFNVKLNPEIRDAIESHLQIIIPPRDENAAAALAYAKDLATPHLEYNPELNEQQLTLSAQTLGRIASELGSKQLRDYTQDSRPKVMKSVLRSALEFKPKILATYLLDYLILNADLIMYTLAQMVNNLSQEDGLYLEIRGLPRISLNIFKEMGSSLSHLQSLSLSLSRDIDIDIDLNLTPIAQLQRLQSLSLSLSRDIDIDIDLTPIAQLQQLQSLNLNLYHDIDLTPITQLQQLRSLSHNRDIDLTLIAQLQRLRSLNLDFNHDIDLTPITQLQRLQSLNLDFNLSFNHGIDLTPITQLQQLLFLSLKHYHGIDLTPIAQLQQLQSLSLKHHHDIDLTPITQLRQLLSLSLNLNRDIDLTPITQLQQLQSLSLKHYYDIDLTHIIQLRRLLSLNLDFYHDIDLAPIAQLQQLQSLSLNLNRDIDLTPITQLRQLLSLNLDFYHDIDLTPITQLQQLQSLSLNLYRDIDLNLTPIGQLTELQSLSLSLFLSLDIDLTPVGQLTGLRFLDIDIDIDIDIDLTSIWQLHNLRELTITGRGIVKGMTLRQLIEDTKIEKLNIFGLEMHIRR